MNQYDIAKLFGGAYFKCASVQNATTGFNELRIGNRNLIVFEHEDFAPSTLIDQPLNDAAPNTADTLSTVTDQHVNVTTSNTLHSQPAMVAPV